MDINIRLANLSDISHVVGLLEIRDNEVYDRQIMTEYLDYFKPEKIRIWIGFVNGDSPVGLTMLFLRDIKINNKIIKAGYWGNLFILPKYRNSMMYIRLVFEMMRLKKDKEIDLIYGCVRRDDVVKGHIGLGFHSIGTIDVLIKLIQPFKFISSYYSIRFIKILGKPLDFIYKTFKDIWALLLSKKYSITTEDIPINSKISIDISNILRNHCSRFISVNWSEEYLLDRYSITRDGSKYRMFIGNSNEGLIGIILWRKLKFNNTVTAVIMDIVFEENKLKLIKNLLTKFESFSITQNCQSIIYLNGEKELGYLMKRAFFIKSPIKFNTLIYPKDILVHYPNMNEISNWRFVFGDHDAF